MLNLLNAETWFVISTLLAPIGFVITRCCCRCNDCESCIPKTDDSGKEINFNELKSMNVSMQLLGRVSIIFGTLLVSMINLIVFNIIQFIADSSEMTELEKVKAYGNIYLYSNLFINCSYYISIWYFFSLFKSTK